MATNPTRRSIHKRGLWARVDLPTRALLGCLLVTSVLASVSVAVTVTLLRSENPAERSTEPSADNGDQHALLSRALLVPAAVGAASALPAVILGLMLLAKLRAHLAIAEALRAKAFLQSDPTTFRVHEAGDLESASWNHLVEALAHTEAASLNAHDASTHARDLAPACDALWFGVVVLDPAKRVRYANGAAINALALDPATARGSSILDAELPPALTEFLAPESPRRGAVEHDDQNRSLRFTLRPFRESDGGGTLLVTEDITHRRAAERARHEFVAHATHELRAPLTNIRLYVEDATEPDADDARKLKALGIINDQADRLERIVADLLDISEIEAASFTVSQGEVRTQAILDDIQHEARTRAGAKGLDVTFELAPRLPVLKGDARRVSIAMHNLVENAIKYTPEGGSVTVRATADAGVFTFEVADTGLGIAPADIASIFEKFKRAADPRVAAITGTGLGLPLAREIARRHGGDITVDSQLNQGSAFTLTLPLPDAEAAVARTHLPPAA